MSEFNAEQQNRSSSAWLHSFQTSTDKPFNSLELVFEPRKVFKYLITIISVLVTIHSIAVFYQYVLNGERAGRWIRLFDLDTEACIPSIYSSFALLLCSVLLAIITKNKYQQTDRYRRYWKFLALTFLYLAIDEAVSIHELMNVYVGQNINTDGGGFFYYAWVIPAIILFSLFSLIYIKFVLSLPKKTRLLFILSAATFVGGAVGVEMIAAKILTLQGTDNLTYALMATVEETLEMVAIAAFIYTLLDYLQKIVKPIILRF